MLRLYDYLHRHATLRNVSLLCLTALLAALVMRLGYKEDISDFLPLDTEDREHLAVYQDISGASRLLVIFTNPGSADRTVEAVDIFCREVSRRDTMGWTATMTAQVDMEQAVEVRNFVYENIPYFLTPADYRRMDSLLTDEEYADRQLQRARETLMLPGGAMAAEAVATDPLGLFTPTVERLGRRGQDVGMEIYDGHLFTPGMTHAVVTMTSPFGNAETERNAQLIALLEDALDATARQHYSDVEVSIAGGPQVAVGNARQIRQDSIIAIALAVTLILTLLLRSLRSVRNILLIALTIGWGWLFALGGMALLHDRVSMIVIGVSSVILGIAVNYPLHLVAHLSHVADSRRALRDICAPLLIGNVTTVGAFMALVPLRSVALSDLGIFASLMLVGTIAFVLIYLPHYARPTAEQRSDGLLTRLAAVRLEDRKWLVAAVALLTVVFAWYAKDTQFDTDMTSLNYMTDSQRRDMERLRSIVENGRDSAMTTVYVASTAQTMDAALDSSSVKQGRIDSLMATLPGTAVHEGVAPFLCSEAEQQRRLRQWADFIGRHHDRLTVQLLSAARRNGFAEDAFTPFHDIISATYTPRETQYFTPLTSGVLAGNISIDSGAGRYSVVDKLHVDRSQAAMLLRSLPGSFTVETMNSAMARTLSDDFNYIGWACSIIVFLFLWFSFGRVELAVLAFLPMAISWVWILGIMTLLGVKFNIVNVILATFIFGQGDDYTIFMTEGCQYEYAHRRPMLASYKNSIALSAIIMFIGIGTLITARHPALHSLAEVTIIGMASVVLMAWLLPPLLFNWLTRHSNGEYRRRPLTVGTLLRHLAAACHCPGNRRQHDDAAPGVADSRAYATLVYERYLYKGQHIQHTVGRNLKVRRCYADTVDRPYEGQEITVENCGYGEEALLMALVHPDKTVVARDVDALKLSVLRSAAEGLVDNLKTERTK